jgi:predicted nucleic-acid-binding Zn-ribbon protein
MFCPKCGAQNADETKFCRGCGAALSNVLELLEGKHLPLPQAEEKYVELYSAGIRGVLLAVGFFIVSGVSFALSSAAIIITLFALMFAFAMLATGISRFVQARALRALGGRDEVPALPTGQQNYVKPPHSIYDTDDLVPASVTERTTKHLNKGDN